MTNQKKPPVTVETVEIKQDVGKESFETPKVAPELLTEVEGKKGKGKETILVRSAKKDGKVALWEMNPKHLDGQAWVCGDGKDVEVYPTAEVLRKIKDGVLLRVNWNT